jgi:hypothetical protein
MTTKHKTLPFSDLKDLTEKVTKALPRAAQVLSVVVEVVYEETPRHQQARNQAYGEPVGFGSYENLDDDGVVLR